MELRSYFWLMVVLVHDRPFETHLVYGVCHSSPGESAMGVFSNARSEIEKSHPAIAGCPILSFTIAPNHL